jgi:hypothetical protein
LNLKCDILVSKFAFSPNATCYYRYTLGKKSFGPNGQHAKAANASRYQAANDQPYCNRTGPPPLVADVGNYAFGGGVVASLHYSRGRSLAWFIRGPYRLSAVINRVLTTAVF